MGSAGGAMVMDTPNCANEAAGTASIRTASNRKRILRMLNHLCQIILRLPEGLCCCGLRGVRGDASSAISKDSTDASLRSVHYGSLFRNLTTNSDESIFRR